MRRQNKISILSAGKSSVRITLLACAQVLINSSILLSQVITNNGAAINITNGIVVNSKDAINTAGLLINSGELNLSGNFTNTAVTDGSSGIFRVGGNWTNTGGVFQPGTSTVIFNGSGIQSIIRTGGETFYNMSLYNTGSPGSDRLLLPNNVTVQNLLTLSSGNILTGTNKLLLSNPAADALVYTSSTESRIVGRFERGVNQTAKYLFPLGTLANYNPANITFNNITSAGTVLSEFLTPASIDSAGLPLPDPPDEVARVYQDGLWNFISNSFSSSDFSIILDAKGFTTFPIQDITRIIKRTTGGSWTLDGTHSPATGTTVYRNNLTGDISPLGTQFTLAQSRPRIIQHPKDTIVCERSPATFTIIATSTRPLTYRWYKEPGILLTGPRYSVASDGTLVIVNAVLSDSGYYYCIVTDDYGNFTRSNSAHLGVNKRPIATVTPSSQDHECSNVPFTNMIFGETAGVPGTTYLWTRTEPAGITTTLPSSGTVLNIGDFIGGTFINETDAPITITFTIVPVGPSPTFCTGETIYATITVNPTPRVIPVSVKDEICDSRNANSALNNTHITLTSPTVTTKGVVRFDYTVALSGLPGNLVGNTTPATDLPPGHVINFTYTNYTDTIQTVTYSITPKVNGLSCPAGPVVDHVIKVHALPLPRITPPPSIDVLQPMTCTSGSGLAALRAVISEGADPYKIIWRGPVGYYMEDSVEIRNLFSGQYTVKVTDNIGCMREDYINIVPQLARGYMVPTPIDPGGYPISCIGSSDGTVTISATGGITPPYNYWLVRNGVDTISTGVFSDNRNPADPTTYRIITGLSAGTYTLYIRDKNGCFDENPKTVTLRPPPPVVVQFGTSNYAGGYNISCKGYNDGAAWVSSISGGRGGYHYRWFTYDGNIPGPDSTYRIDNLIAGTYYLEVTDTLGCITIFNVTLTEPPGIELSGYRLSSSRDSSYNISCNGFSDGSIDITVTGGSGTYNFSWTGPDGFTANTEDLKNLKAGTYSATITDVSNTTCILMPLPVFTLTEPAPLNVNAVPSVSPDGNHNINCSGGTGSIDLTVSGGSPGNYRFNWSTDNGSGIVQGMEDQFALTAGKYNVVVTDSNLCVATTEIVLTEPEPLTISLVPKHITCETPGFSNGSIDLTVTGGVPPYSYQWSNGATTEDISNLSEGYYSVTVTDVNGCRITDSIRINLPPAVEFNSILSDYNGYNVSCTGYSNGYINIEPTGGEAPFTYLWQGPDGFSSNERNISGLKAGQYQLIVTDANLCTATETFVLNEPEKISLDLTLSRSNDGNYNINCAGDTTGSISVEAVNFVGGVSFLWPDGYIGKTRTGLKAGTYRLIAIDRNGCHADTSVTLTQPDTIRILFSVTPPFCPDSPDGEISIEVHGGIEAGGYMYRWSDNSTGQSLTNLTRGVYRVKVMDANNCTVTDSVRLETLNESCLVIPNAFSPNNDNINDEWNIGMKHLYPQMEVKVFNRWGELVWKSEKGYPQPWDGRSNGVLLPMDSYHYIIDLHNGKKSIIGNVTIVR
ncbi:MAG TPA: gliding motility-associated C-terminal domain-containing protein [Bacteroidales bacterium]|nr:gliding motility-associated C-terminal domain-containing protein [Bacteroidales bacterium]HOM39439.1 gliding motility-associated C-terminal domain-containing protein [Bacteroidales bacterium]HOU30473.1 gliding motility-associated C-terminal domain-containing protein [Bacteroidales bacterium]